MSKLSVQHKPTSTGVPWPTDSLLPKPQQQAQATGAGSEEQPIKGLSKLQQQYSPLQWNDFFDQRVMLDDTIPVYTAGTGGHLLVCLHGAGHSALTFAALAERLKPKNTVVAFDFRGHGGHYSDNEADLSQAELIDETLRVLQYVELTHKNRSIILLGHSMGGSIACKVAYKIEQEMKDSTLNKACVALFVIDVVEGTAMDALPFME